MLFLLLSVILAAVTDVDSTPARGKRRTQREDTNGLVALMTLGCFGCVCLGAAGLYQLSTLGSALSKHRRTKHDAEQLMGRMQAFAGDPNGGRLLDWFYREHPAYGRPLPNVDGLPDAPASSIIERQTVVVRCKYCRAMTPVNDEVCHYCGAGNFS